MKRGTFRHPKTGDLAAALGITRLEAFGLLGALMEWISEYAPAGDVGRWTDETIAKAVDWPGAPGGLVDGLCRAHWFDLHPEHRLVVHQWPQHAEDWVHRRLAREGRRFATGEVPNLARFSRAQQARLRARYGCDPGCGERVDSWAPIPGARNVRPSLASPRHASPSEDLPHARARRPPRQAAARPAPSPDASFSTTRVVEKQEPASAIVQPSALFQEALQAIRARGRDP